MDTRFQPLETIDISCLGGLRFVDRASGRPIVHGLAVSATRKGIARSLPPSASGVFVLHRFPGFGPSERWDGKGDPPQISESFEVTVMDMTGDFLPVRFPSRLPMRAEVGRWCGDSTEPSLPIPLYSAPKRVAPAGFQQVRGWLVGRDTRQPACWARIQVSCATTGNVLGEGMTDERGAFLVPIRMPAPVPLPAPAPGEDPSAIYRITVEAGRPGGAADGIPDWCEVLAQPAVKLLARLPDEGLTTREIKLHQDLTLKTLDSRGDACSELFFVTS